MPPQVTCASALPDKSEKHENRIFTQMMYFALPEFNQLLDFSFFWPTTHTHAAVWLPKSCNQCVQLGAVGGVVQKKRSQERGGSWPVWHAQCTSVLSSGLSISQGNAEALERWSGKTKHRPFFYFLSNISAKNYHNRIVCQDYRKSKVRRFWDTVYVGNGIDEKKFPQNKKKR